VGVGPSLRGLHDLITLTRMALNVQPLLDFRMCPERITLLHEYNQATAAYAQAVDQLHKRIGVSSKAEYENLKQSSEEARSTAERARTRLKEHVAIHGCEGDALAVSAG